MRQINKHKIEEIIEIIQEIYEFIEENNAIILVEGKKDKNALKNFAHIPSKKIITTRHITYEELVQKIEDKKVMDFLDDDEEGHYHQNEIKKRGIHLYSHIKRKLFNILTINRTEDLSIYICHLPHLPKDLLKK